MLTVMFTFSPDETIGKGQKSHYSIVHEKENKFSAQIDFLLLLRYIVRIYYNYVSLLMEVKRVA